MFSVLYCTCIYKYIIKPRVIYYFVHQLFYCTNALYFIDCFTTLSMGLVLCRQSPPLPLELTLDPPLTGLEGGTVPIVPCTCSAARGYSWKFHVNAAV